MTNNNPATTVPLTTSKYIPTIGLEIHAELRTTSKMFCSCKNDPDEEIPNKNICPVCLAHPGTLPVLNMEAIRQVIRMGTAVDGTIADFTEWDRKNYFYPDIPKGYQISQFKYPLVSGGTLAGVAVERIHLEEDTAQSTHDSHEKSLINFNRAGVPLMELVTKPVIHDAATAVRFAKELQLLLRYLGAGEANMEKGEMRVEANISIATPTNTAVGKFGTKTEVKNLNSFRSVEKAIECEVIRQTELLEKGERVVQETRGWDDVAGETYSQRKKESSHDYRYFPDPDIPKLKISEMPELAADIIRKSLPELPAVKRDRYKNSFGMTDKEVAVFVEAPEVANYFEMIIATFGDNSKTTTVNTAPDSNNAPTTESPTNSPDSKKIKLTVNYLLTDYLGLLKKNGGKLGQIKPETFAKLIEMIADGKISSRGAKDLLVLLTTNNVAADDLHSFAEKNSLLQKSDLSDLGPIIDSIISANAGVVTEYKAGKTASFQFLIGQTMKATKGSANPEVIRKLLIEKIG